VAVVSPAKLSVTGTAAVSSPSPTVTSPIATDGGTSVGSSKMR
jgi:hypothetical protein